MTYGQLKQLYFDQNTRSSKTLRSTDTIKPGRVAWLQVARGSVQLNEHQLKGGDGVAIDRETKIDIQGIDRATEVLLFDMVA
jgi:quercetin 2,3-dioxygenase